MDCSNFSSQLHIVILGLFFLKLQDYEYDIEYTHFNVNFLDEQ